eukprot:TRINITY_DN12782_c0_g1_i1.p2 TRINITY_DN12782_c0_g1~~TRINITY_DN12782_c0_g1_i1.p2  ORF type:complete len:108 (+),score=26.13 TRINITY_DN12782_c0_g1_i1:126-449(+)
MYDSTEPASFLELSEWASMIEKSSRGKFLDVMILASKYDLTDKIAVDPTMGEEFARGCGALFFEVSSLSGHNVDVALAALALKTKKRAEMKIATDQTKQTQGWCLLC